MDNQTNNPSDPGAAAPSDQTVPVTPPSETTPEPVQEPAQPSWPQPEVSGGEPAGDQGGAVQEGPAPDPNVPVVPEATENGSNGEQGGGAPTV